MSVSTVLKNEKNEKKEFIPLVYNIIKDDDNDIKSNITDYTLSKSINYPQMSLGFNHIIHTN